tara:strand:+ start:15382 stop:15726 length:345 start_codon:yes stop_codon:yes gene_type:complete
LGKTTPETEKGRKMKATNIELASDLYKAGLDEDGYDYEAELYYVVIDLEDGRRFQSNDYFLGCKTGFDEEGEPFFQDIRDEAEAKAEALASTFDREDVDLDDCFEARSPTAGWY